MSAPGGSPGGTIADILRALRHAEEPQPAVTAPTGATPRWGASAVSLPTGAADLVPAPPANRPAPVGEPYIAPAPDPLVRLLQSRRRRRERPSQPPAGPAVAVLALAGGAGVSCLCRALAGRWVAAGRRTVLVDASGPIPGVAVDVKEAAEAGRWRSMATAGEAAAFIAAALRSRPMAVIGGSTCPDPQLLAAVSGAARSTAAVVIDLPARHEYLADVIPGLGADVVVMCCPARRDVLRASAGFLRGLDTRAVWPPVVWAITGRPGRGARAAIAAGTDVTAGWVRLQSVRSRRGLDLIMAAADVAAALHDERTTR